MTTILIVEDDPDITRSLAIRLRREGYEIACAVDAVLATTVAVKSRPDLAILDISIPGGSGFQVAERIQNLSTLAGTPILFITASKEPELRERAEALGAVGFFEKPYEATKLIELVRRVLEFEDELEVS